MELCDLSLEAYIQGESCSALEPLVTISEEKRPTYLLEIVEQIVDGLTMIHLHREIHRDITPSNGTNPSNFATLTVSAVLD